MPRHARLEYSCTATANWASHSRACSPRKQKPAWRFTSFGVAVRLRASIPLALPEYSERQKPFFLSCSCLRIVVDSDRPHKGLSSSAFNHARRTSSGFGYTSASRTQSSSLTPILSLTLVQTPGGGQIAALAGFSSFDKRSVGS